MQTLIEPAHAEACTCQSGWLSPECAQELRDKVARLSAKVEYQNQVIAELSSDSETLIELRDSLPDISKAVAAGACQARNDHGWPHVSVGSDRVTTDVDGPTLHGEAAVELPGWQECGLPFSARLVAQVWEIE